MESWEFLLQQEGARSWLPIKTPSLEIKEGRYRVAAHSSRANTDVEISISYQPIEDASSVRRSLTRTNRTNLEGLMVVMPFTYLKPGLWETRCSSDMMSNFLGETWNQAIRLQVLPKTATTSPLTSPNATTANAPLTGAEIVTVSQPEHEITIQMPAASEALAELVEDQQPEKVNNDPLVNPLLEDSLQKLDEMLQQVIEPLLQGVESSESIQNTPSDRQSLPSNADTAPSKPSFQQRFEVVLALHEENLTALKGEPVTLLGQVDIKTHRELNGSNSTQAGNLVFKGELHCQLRHPQNLQVLLDVRQPLSGKLPTFYFSCNLALPATASQTHLLLGTIALYNSLNTVLASESFTITVDLEGLLQAILTPKPEVSTEGVEEKDKTELPPEAPHLQRKKLILWNSHPEIPQNLLHFQSSTSNPLPPQLYQPTSQEKTSKPLQLPKLPQPQASNLELEQGFFPPEDGSTDEELPEDKTIEVQEESPFTLTPQEQEQLDAFQALNFPERFSLRLNSLATKAQVSEALTTELLPEENVTEENLFVEEVKEENLPVDNSPVEEVKEENLPVDNSFVEDLEEENLPDTLTPEATAHVLWNSREIVVDDDIPASQPPTSEQKTAKVDSPTLKSQPQATPPILYQQLEDKPVPTPLLFVRKGELVAGESIIVRVTLPPHEIPIYVKLWIQDRQSRLLLDEPRLLVDFMPSTSGNLEAMIQLTVPFGSLEIRFEAIAIDNSTQRESHKVTVDRIVIPPDVSGLSSEEF